MTDDELIGYIVAGVMSLLLALSEYLGSKFYLGQSNSIHQAVLGA